MVRVKRGTLAAKKRRALLAKTKGYRYGRSKKEREAREAHLHAGAHAFSHRRKKKGDFRRLWTIRINAAVRSLGLPYNRCISALQSNGITLNRKMLMLLAHKYPKTFKRLIEKTGLTPDES